MKKKRSSSHKALTGVLMATSAVGIAPVKLPAQGVEARGRAPQGGSQQPAARPERFDVPAGPLDAALKQFEAATSLTLRIDAPIVGMQTKGVQGEFTPQQALNRLLDGTGLTYVFTGEKVVMLRPRGSTVLDAVNVTATPRMSSPKYTAPQVDITRSVAVISKDILQAQGATSLRDAIRNVPGITINAGEGGGGMPGDNFNIRGFSAANDLFVDGVRDLSGFARESFNLEQVEVLKGPNSGITGRGSTGGTINMVTKVPSLRADRSGAIVLGSADQRRATADVNQPLNVLGIPGAAFRVSAVSSNSGVAGNDVIEYNSWGVAPSLSVGLGTSTQVTLAYTRSEQDNTPSYGVETFNEVPKVDTRHFFGLRSLDFEKVNSNNLALKAAHVFNEHLTLRNQFSSAHSDVGRIVTPVNPTTGARSPKTHAVENDILTNQTNLTSSFETGKVGHDFVAGAEFTRENSLRGAYTIATRPFPTIANLNAPTADADYQSAITRTVTRTVRAQSAALYAFETMKIGSKLELNGGLRWDSYKPEYTDSASKATIASTGNAPVRTTNVSGNAAVNFKPTVGSSLYFSYGTSFNPATENLSNDAVSANSKLPPEKSRSLEVGAKWELFKQRLLTSFALFRTEKTNARTTDPANPGLGTILAGKQKVEGGEVSVTGRITQGWAVLAGYSRMIGKYVESPNPAQTDAPFTNVPAHSLNAWTSYAVTKRLEVGGGGRYVDRRLLRATATSTVYVPAYRTYDAMAKYQLSSTLGLQVNLLNLTDELYYDSGRMWVPAAGRAVSVTTSVKF
ncbi:MAG TPA: TonB-dependent siderophore receptor [Gemmatimonas sp.]|uniref:TonB-dependent siderophore receptor n=1 Tax=Gemmatimonas sp. TaxID=1962908 RepID=UPI002ED8BC3A